MIFGVDYYPEHWPRAQWPDQARQIRALGCNTVRLAEFSWGLLEPSEGVFDFSWLDEAIAVLAEQGIQVILGTPTAAPPRWLAERYDILQRDRYGRPRPWGSRRECCANNPAYLARADAIVQAMAQHYAQDPHVIGWQIDNEFGCHDSARCYCEHCRRAFAAQMAQEYGGDIAALNKAWGTAFWSLQYPGFDSLDLPGYNSAQSPTGDAPVHNPSLSLAYRRFASQSWVRFLRRQADILRRYTDKPITHNLMGHFTDIDYFALARELDLVSWDNYPQTQWEQPPYQYISLSHELMRGLKDRNFVVMEEQAGPAGWDRMGPTPAPGQLRLWSWQAIAHGGEGLVYFRFRTALFGTEQYWFGVLDHDGIPRRRFYELQYTGQELKKLSGLLVGTRPVYDALLVNSYDNIWSHEIKSHREGFSFGDLFYAYYKAGLDIGLATAVGALAQGLEGYRIVFMPAYNLLHGGEEALAARYVAQGGVLVLTFRSGTRDANNNILPLPAPGPFVELFGVQVEEFDAPCAPVAVAAADGSWHSAARLWCDILDPQPDAEVLATYADGWYAGRAAVTVRRVGRGAAIYVGCDLEDGALQALVRFAAACAGIHPAALPAGVEMARRPDCRILLNHNGTPTDTGVQGLSLLDGAPFAGTLPAYGVQVLVPEG